MMRPKVSRLIAVSLGAHFLTGSPVLLVVAVVVIGLVAVLVLALVIYVATCSRNKRRRKDARAVLRILRG
jgi:Flp pilus assembly protein TadB